MRVKKVQSLLEMLKPKLILFPEWLRSLYSVKHDNILLYYSTNVQLRVPSFKGFEILLEKGIASQLKPKKLKEGNLLHRGSKCRHMQSQNTEPTIYCSNIISSGDDWQRNIIFCE